MILIPKIAHPKLHTDLSLLHQKYVEIWVHFEISKNKTERSTLLNNFYIPNKFNKTEFAINLLHQLTSHSPMIQYCFMGNYNLNYFNTEEKECLDTILTTYNIEAVNKSIATHSKTLID